MAFKDIEKKRAWENKYQRENRAFYKSMRRCIICQRQDAYTLAGRVRCEACSEKARAYNNAYLHENRDRYNEAARDKYAERKKAGKCVNCGADMHGDPHSRCEKCRAKDAARHRKGNPKGVNGMCSVCGKNPAMEGKKVCPSCYRNCCEAAAKGRKKVNTENHPWRRDEQLRIMSITGRAV